VTSRHISFSGPKARPQRRAFFVGRQIAWQESAMTRDTDVGLFDAIYTTRAIRRFKPDPVPDELLRRVLEAAGQAPSGGNREPWRFFVIRKDEAKEELRELLRNAAEKTGSDPANLLALTDAPVVIIVCAVEGTVRGPGSVGPFGQTYPAIQN